VEIEDGVASADANDHLRVSVTWRIPSSGAVSGVLCWHRPGRMIGRTTTCRHCGVAIEECGHEPRKRHEEPCPCCGGSFWVAIVRGTLAKFAEYLETRK